MIANVKVESGQDCILSFVSIAVFGSVLFVVPRLNVWKIKNKIGSLIKTTLITTAITCLIMIVFNISTFGDGNLAGSENQVPALMHFISILLGLNLLFFVRTLRRYEIWRNYK